MFVPSTFRAAVRIIAVLLSVATSDAQSLINVKLAGSNPGTPGGAAVIGGAGDTWNYFANLNGRASGGGVVTNATRIVDSNGAVLSGVSMTMSLSAGTGLNSYTDTTSYNPIPPLLMGNYVYQSAGTNYFTFAFTGLPSNTAYMIYGMGNGNQSGQGSTWWADAANGHATASASANYSSGDRKATLASNEGICWVKVPATTTTAGALTFRVVELNAAENGTGGSGRAYLDAFQLQQLSAPVVTGLTNQTAIAGTSVVLSANVAGTPAASLQWRSNSVAVFGATNSSLTLNNIQYSQNGTMYSLVASNLVGAATNSMTLSVVVSPGIIGLNNQAAPVGETVTIQATVSGVPAPVTRWQFNQSDLSDGPAGSGSSISGSATATLVISNAQAADSGFYSLIASNSAGVVTNSMTLTVSSGAVAPAITGPADQTVVQTSNATFSASVSGLPVPALQWLVNGTEIDGATNSSLMLANVQYSQNGFVYSLVAGNSAGSATNRVQLFVLVPAAISQQPTNISVVAGSAASLSVTAVGVPSVSYQWSRNGSPIPKATNAVYTIANCQGSDSGAYSVTVSNSVGLATSAQATLTVLSTMTGVLLPTNGAVNISPDQQLRIVFSGTPHLGIAGNIYVRDAADGSTFATIDLSQFQMFSLWSAVISNAAARTIQGSSYYYMPVAIYGNEAWITLSPTNRFAYNRTYYVNSDPGVFLDSANASFPAITSTNAWRFTTRTSGPGTPGVSTGPTNLTIGLDGSGDFATLQGASDWVPQNNTLRRTFTVLPGTYRDFAVFSQNRNNVTIIGTGADRRAVQLVYPYAAYSGANDKAVGTLRLESSDIYVRNLTIDNTVYLTNNGVVFAGPINTVATSGSRLIFDNVLIKGGQDTLYTIGGIAYFNRCEIWGSVDFIYGGALSVFDQCNIVEIRFTGGPVTAPSTTYAAPYGLVFLSCTFPQALIANGYPYDVAANTTTMMRPWQQDAFTAIINCAVGPQVTTKGWSEWSGRETTCRAREYGTVLINGGSVSPAQRQAAGAYWLNTIDPDYTNNPSLSPTNSLLYGPGGTNNRVAVIINPADYTIPAIFGNSYFNLNGWLPTVIPTITTQPTNQSVSAGATATFAAAATGLPVPAFQWMQNGTNVPSATNAMLIITNARTGDTGTYSVIASNSAGSVVSSGAILSVTVPVNTTPTNLVAAVIGSTIQLSWPSDHLGWRLQFQTNAANEGLGTNWKDWPGSTNVFQTNIVINPAAGSAFFRLLYP